MDHPIILLINTDKNQSTNHLITNIRKKSADKDVMDYENCKVYIHNVITKYYDTKITLLPTENFESLNESLKRKSEGILIYFDSHDRSVLNSLPLYKNFIEQNKIEFSILLCKELTEDENIGVTFNCIKSIYNKFDIIELERKSSDDDYDLCGFDELAQALQVFPSTIPSGIKNSSIQEDNDDDNPNVELEMEKFESLLSQVMQFRPNTINMSRDDRLNYAQNFAQVFENLLLNDAADDDTD